MTPWMAEQDTPREAGDQAPGRRGPPGVAGVGSDPGLSLDPRIRGRGVGELGGGLGPVTQSLTEGCESRAASGGRESPWAPWCEETWGANTRGSREVICSGSSLYCTCTCDPGRGGTSPRHSVSRGRAGQKPECSRAPSKPFRYGRGLCRLLPPEVPAALQAPDAVSSPSCR